MTTGVQLALQGYIGLAGYLLGEWGDYASTIATQLDAGTLTADDVANNLANGTILAAQSAVLVVNEAFDAAAVLSGSQDQAQIVDSQPFATGAGVVASVRTLRLAGPLVADLHNDSLPEAVVAIVPTVLQIGDTSFSLQANATGHHAGGYSGTVNVLDATGAVVDSVTVWLTV